MIEIVDKRLCCGCSACVQRCPKKCITLKEDKEGFLYPVADVQLCIECGLCEEVCPVIHQGIGQKPLAIYAAINRDESIRAVSSSGGVFTPLAVEVLRKGGVVFGARFNEKWEVEHDFTDCVEGLSAFRGSKYVQSRIGDSYCKAEYFLQKGRTVLFSGTPCQIAGLKRYLRKEYDNLLTVDIVCHGVPSPKVWRKYKEEIVARQCDKKFSFVSPRYKEGKIEDISFRNKSLGWKKFSFVLTFSMTGRHGDKNTVLFSESVWENRFMEGFLADIYLRPSCYRCPVRRGKSGSDISIADFWGVGQAMPEIDDDRGISLALIWTERGKSAYEKQHLESHPVTMEEASLYNGGFKEVVSEHPERAYFFRKLDKARSVSRLIHFCARYAQAPKRKRIRLLIKRFILFGI